MNCAMSLNLYKKKKTFINFNGLESGVTLKGDRCLLACLLREEKEEKEDKDKKQKAENREFGRLSSRTAAKVPQSPSQCLTVPYSAAKGALLLLYRDPITRRVPGARPGPLVTREPRRTSRDSVMRPCLAAYPLLLSLFFSFFLFSFRSFLLKPCAYYSARELVHFFLL